MSHQDQIPSLDIADRILNAGQLLQALDEIDREEFDRIPHLDIEVNADLILKADGILQVLDEIDKEEFKSVEKNTTDSHTRRPPIPPDALECVEKAKVTAKEEGMDGDVEWMFWKMEESLFWWDLDFYRELINRTIDAEIPCDGSEFTYKNEGTTLVTEEPARIRILKCKKCSKQFTSDMAFKQFYCGQKCFSKASHT